MLGFRPPQFSEDVAWLPTWPQRGDFEVEDLEKNHVTFEQRIEDYQFLKMNINDVESSGKGGGCNISQLFLSGTDDSPFSPTQSSNDVVGFHLRLSSDGISENSTPIMDAFQAESNFHLVMQPIENSLRLGQEAINISSIHDSGAMDCVSEFELHRPFDKNELLKPDHNVKHCEDSVDEVELCVAASETLVINDIIENDSSVKPSASSILEASIQVKHARLEAWKNTFGDSVDNIGEIDNLSDLDDISMESAYKDAGIHFDESDAIELGISQVKDTMDSGYDVKTGAASDCCTIADSSTRGMNDALENDKQLKKDLVSECFDTKKKIVYVGMDRSYIFRTKVGSLSNTRFCVLENNDKLLNNVEERFQSRWFGGWTWKDKGNGFNAIRHSIPNPYMNETSFFSESVDVVPDEKSSVQNSKRKVNIASQISVPSENFSDKAGEGIMLSQDIVKSSSATYFDPLCSVVPCSISEDICSLPVVNHDDNNILPRHFSITTEKTQDNMSAVSASDNDLAQGQGTTVEISDTEKSHHTVYRKFTSLKNYSTIFPNDTTFLEKDSTQKIPLLQDNVNLIFHETPFASCTKIVKCGVEPPVSLKEKNSLLSPVANSINWASNNSIFDIDKENLGPKALPGDYIRCEPIEIPKWKLLKCQKQSVKHHPASSRVPFLVKETNIPSYEKHQQIQTVSRTCSSPAGGKKSNRSSQHIESRHMNIFMKNHLDEEKRRLIFQHMEFLLTGFSLQKEKEIKGLIQKHGGIVLPHISSTHMKKKRSSRVKFQVLPIILCLKKVYSAKFLYGCAVNAHVLKADWLLDSVASNFVLPMKKYMIIFRNTSKMHAVKYDAHPLIFNDVGIMLHGKSKRFTNISIIVKHGGGKVFKTLQRMVQSLEAGRISAGVIVSDNENCASRHLKICALEKNVPMTSIDWVIKSLYAGQLIPLKEKRNSKRLPPIKIQRLQDNMELSPEF